MLSTLPFPEGEISLKSKNQKMLSFSWTSGSYLFYK